jgi:hypothetical protein
MAALVDGAVAHGLVRLKLLADGGNRPALAFYRKTGWQETQLICLRKSDLSMT